MAEYETPVFAAQRLEAALESAPGTAGVEEAAKNSTAERIGGPLLKQREKWRTPSYYWSRF
jgi:hypothetical protein